jgi:hypothetical protein
MKCISEHAVLAVSAYMPHYEYMELFKGIEMEPGTSPYGLCYRALSRNWYIAKPCLVSMKN